MSDDLPSLASLAFEGLIAEPAESITEADILDAEVEQALQDRDDWTHPEDETGGEEPDGWDNFYEIDERLAWGGLDVPS